MYILSLFLSLSLSLSHIHTCESAASEPLLSSSGTGSACHMLPLSSMYVCDSEMWHVCVYVVCCMVHVCIYVCMYVYMYVCTYTRLYTHIYIHISTGSQSHAHRRVDHGRRRGHRARLHMHWWPTLACIRACVRVCGVRSMHAGHLLGLQLVVVVFAAPHHKTLHGAGVV
jgi:hypothetical protein